MKFNSGASCRIADQNSSKQLRSSKTWKDEKMSQQEEPKETWQLNVMWDPATEKGYQVKN